MDAFRHLEPEAVGYTRWDYRGGAFRRNAGLRIDLILATKSVVGRSTSTSIDRNARKGEKPSDHAPVLLEFPAP